MALGKLSRAALLVALVSQAAGVLPDCDSDECRASAHALQKYHNAQNPETPMSISHAMREMDKDKGAIDTEFTNETGASDRRSVTTILNETGV